MPCTQLSPATNEPDSVSSSGWLQSDSRHRVHRADILPFHRRCLAHSTVRSRATHANSLVTQGAKRQHCGRSLIQPSHNNVWPCHFASLLDSNLLPGNPIASSLAQKGIKGARLCQRMLQRKRATVLRTATKAYCVRWGANHCCSHC